MTLTTSPATATATTFVGRSLELINQARAANGAAALAVSPALAAIAQDAPFTGCGGLVVTGRSADMGARNYFSHAIKDCGNESVFDMLVAGGIVHSGAGENLAFMSGTDDEVLAAENIHNQLMADLDHRANLLNPNFTHVGIGLFRSFAQPWTGSPGNQPLTRVFLTSQVFARNPSSPPPTVAGDAYHVLTPARLLDTRAGGAKLGAGATLNVPVAGAGGVPATGVTAVVLNVTVTGPSAASFLTVFPSGEALPPTSNVTFTAGSTVANLVACRLGAGGQVTLFNLAGATHVIVDVAGWFGPGAGSRFHPVAPSRILDTRAALNAPGPIGPDAILNVPVLNRGGLPATGVAAVVLTLTAVAPTAATFLTAFASGANRPPTSNLNVAAGGVVANLVVAPVGAGGAIAIANGAGTTHVVADVAGWFDQGDGAGGLRYHPLSPARILDTRSGLGAPAGAVGPGGAVALQVAGAGGVPASGAVAALVNLTVTEPTAPSFLTAFPTGTPRPATSNVNVAGGQTVPGLVAAALGDAGRLSLVNAAGSCHLIADVAGWFGLD